jgi:hypothetical protein
LKSVSLVLGVQKVEAEETQKVERSIWDHRDLAGALVKDQRNSNSSSSSVDYIHANVLQKVDT